MKKSFNKLFVSGLIIIACTLLLTPNVFAALEAPFVTASGGFDYNADTNELSITMGLIGTVAHSDGSYAACNGSEMWCVPPTPSDPLYGGTFTISSLYNGDGAGENWTFAPLSGSSPDFILYDYLDNERLSAEIYDFTVVQNGSLFEVNVNFDQDNAGSIITNSNTPSSEFISDVDSFSLPWGNLYMKFNFSDTTATDFTEDQFGSVTGTFSVVHEPVSSVLFITGGAVLAFRRFRRSKILQDS